MPTRRVMFSQALQRSESGKAEIGLPATSWRHPGGSGGRGEWSGRDKRVRGGGGSASSPPSPPWTPEVCNGSDSRPGSPLPPGSERGRTGPAAAQASGNLLCGAAGPGDVGPNLVLGLPKRPAPALRPQKGARSPTTFYPQQGAQTPGAAARGHRLQSPAGPAQAGSPPPLRGHRLAPPPPRPSPATLAKKPWSLPWRDPARPLRMGSAGSASGSAGPARGPCRGPLATGLRPRRADPGLRDLVWRLGVRSASPGSRHLGWPAAPLARKPTR
ncbi:basic salivary proline-rich protein 1-like [Lepus europaeus]|uniref:basic salivary proline-rich protein 1-like n=1 Tax=Lepus europaeus TaxID=9983 RepID=UPI002B47B199|nr:basic salivary proline-rich protein 1-like [Lepus europaeus]